MPDDFFPDGLGIKFAGNNQDDSFRTFIVVVDPSDTQVIKTSYLLQFTKHWCLVDGSFKNFLFDPLVCPEVNICAVQIIKAGIEQIFSLVDDGNIHFECGTCQELFDLYPEEE